MKALLKAAFLPAAALIAGGCEVRVDNQTAERIENAAGAVTDDLGNAAGDAVDTAGQLGNAVQEGARDVGNNVDVDVDLGRDGNGAAANTQ